MRGEGDDRHVATLRALARADRGRRLEPVHLRHLDVHQDDVEPLAIERLQRLPTVLDRNHRMAPLLEQADSHLAVHGIVLGEQHPQRVTATKKRRGRRLRSRTETLSSHTCREVEDASPADFALEPHVPAHQPHDVRGDGEAEARAPVPPTGRAVALHERLEDRLLILARDADAGVGNAAVQQRLVRRRLGVQPDGHPTLSGELDRVVDELLDHLAEASRVPRGPLGHRR